MAPADRSPAARKSGYHGKHGRLPVEIGERVHRGAHGVRAMTYLDSPRARSYARTSAKWPVGLMMFRVSMTREAFA